MGPGGTAKAGRRRRLTPEGARLLRFVLVGLSNTVLTLVSYAALVSLGVFYIAAGVVGWSLGIANGYFWNRTWTFRAGPHQHELLVKYAAVGVGGLCLNSGLLALVVDVAGADKSSGQFVVLPVVVLTSFAANRFWTFDEHMESAAPRAGGGDHP